MSKTFAAFLLAGCVVAGAGAGAQGPQDPQPRPPSFHSSADVVTIRASVRDKRGRPLTGLAPSDFEVRDNGLLRPILALHSDTRSPVSLAVVVDMSGSMRLGSNVAVARQAFDSVLAQLRPGEDEVGLFTFDVELHERRPFTQDVSTLSDALADFHPFGSTSLYDATAEAARRLVPRPASHKAIIVITDGLDTSSRMTPAEVSGLASSIDVPVYVVATTASANQRGATEDAARARRDGSAGLRDLVEWTGGQLVFAVPTIDSSGLIAELRQQYVLAIEAATTREWRSLGIRVKQQPKASVKARSGYFGG